MSPFVFTFFESSFIGSLAVGEDRLDKDAHVASRRVVAADDAEPETLLAGALLEHHVLDEDLGLLERPPLTRSG